MFQDGKADSCLKAFSVSEFAGQSIESFFENLENVFHVWV
jgi:hypothetical protein